MKGMHANEQRKEGFEKMGERIGFIGLGQMGHAMASNLLKDGYNLHVYNRTHAKAAVLAGQGAKVVRHPAQTAEPGGIVMTSLANDHAVEHIVFDDQGLLDRLGPNGIHVSMSTISPGLARRLVDHHKRYKVSYVAAPVFGRPEAAAARELWIVLSGSRAAKDRVRPILAALGQGLFDFGKTPWAANIVKLCGNFLIASAIEGLGEALALAEKNGIDRLRLADMLGKTLFACPVYQGYGQRIAAHRYKPAGFRLALGLKDLDLVLQAAAVAQVPMPVASLLHDRFLSAMAKGRSEIDWAAIALGVAEDAGLKRGK
jgi:3-hydroxyisobutyrate dehydrogenase-like beta-hydroxyacid dehydrogenase